MKRRLSEKEEVIMHIIWTKGQIFAKEVREALPEPKPHISTVSTMMRRLAEKGFLAIEDFGSTHRYSATIGMKDYTTRFVQPLLAGLFGNSIKNAISFFAEQEQVSVEELREIMEMIEKRKK
ncbi:BlaI/MecI/CopY family transcriptional regulator [Pedobacter sp. Hv1]|uniref:BlaI/MecI/CopY family transcriptional regulator n=1 Tax=Pedobacter sp. Hv1 TaxID=1740090 RepID=UPI0006D8D478|nr:BlaI/MecI/CopY family transcriptional regulator [Pedobacter sp. Hv1]KQC00904.1 transcriptional regulator [Pedobacter sp. Hv1]